MKSILTLIVIGNCLVGMAASLMIEFIPLCLEPLKKNKR